MPETPNRSIRAWHWMVGILAVTFLVVVAIAMWSEREDADRLPAEELERRGEEPWAPEPIDSPAVPRPAPEPGG